MLGFFSAISDFGKKKQKHMRWWITGEIGVNWGDKAHLLVKAPHSNAVKQMFMSFFFFMVKESEQLLFLLW